MSFVSRDSSRPEATDASGRQVLKWQWAARSDRLADATLACPDCDAPVALAPGRVSVTEPLDCPYCGLHAPVRDFLSLAQPTRATRVVVRVGHLDLA